MTIRTALEELAALIGGIPTGLEEHYPAIHKPHYTLEFPEACYRSPENECNGVTTLGGCWVRFRESTVKTAPKEIYAEATADIFAAIAAIEGNDWELAKLIQQHTHVIAQWTDSDLNTFIRHLNNGRLQKAREMLTTPNMTA